MPAVRIVVSLDGWAALREFAGETGSDLGAAVSLAELAGVDALRLSIQADRVPVRDSDVDVLRRCAHSFELRMPISQALLEIPLAARPNRVVLVADRSEARGSAPPLDARVEGPALASVLRSLEEAGLRTAIRIAPDVDAVRAAHAQGVREVEIFTGHLVDLPDAERRGALLALGDAARLASKLRLGIGIAGKLDDRNTAEILEAAPAIERVVFGRGLARRAMLIGLDRAIRDFRDRMR